MVLLLFSTWASYFVQSAAYPYSLLPGQAFAIYFATRGFIVAGEATITIGLTLADGERRAFPVTVPPGGSVRSEVAGYVLTLTDLFPDPPPERMSDSLYRASLILTRP